MTHTAAATRTLPLPAVGHQGRRRGSAPARCHRARPTIAYSDHVNSSKAHHEQLTAARRGPVYSTVLVPLDGSHLADGAIPTACALATRFGATVHNVTVVASDLDRQRIRGKAADALGTDSHMHVEVDTDVAGAVQRCAAHEERQPGATSGKGELRCTTA